MRDMLIAYASISVVVSCVVFALAIHRYRRGPRPTGETYLPQDDSDVPWPPLSPTSKNKTDMTGWEK